MSMDSVASVLLKARGRSTNDNVTSKIEVNNDNDIGKIPQKSEKSSAKSTELVDGIADKLVIAFNNPGARAYYCLVAIKLSEATIWNNVELAKRSNRSPVRYFTWLCQKAMG